MKKILSIDGGGIRGIVPGQVLIEIEKRIQTISGNQKARIAEYFDFFAGTSTGGILTCLLLCPDDNDPTKPKFSAEEAVALYVNNGEKIFDTNLWQKIINFNSILDEKYSAKALEELLDFYFGNLKLSQLLKPCLITAYDIQDRKTHFFAQHDFKRAGKGKDFLIKDVCRATSAAPTYFETALIKSLSGVTYPLIDGGVFANNPSLCAYSEVRNAIGEPTAKDMFIVSIGTGGESPSYEFNKAKDWGGAGWIKPIIDIMMSAASETTDYHMRKMFAANGNQANYIRIQPDNLRNADSAMDNATQENINSLVELGVWTSEEYSDDLNKVIDQLILGPDAVSFS